MRSHSNGACVCVHCLNVQIRGLFTDTNIYLLCVTMAVATLHILLDVLAFKNDISFWRQRKDMVGLSFRTQVWHCISHTV